MCIINSFSITKIRDSPFSLFTWYQSLGRKKNLIISGLSVNQLWETFQ